MKKKKEEKASFFLCVLVGLKVATYFRFDDVSDGNIVSKDGLVPDGIDVGLERTEADVHVVRAVLDMRSFPICKQRDNRERTVTIFVPPLQYL